jgi:hypothetical protein
LFLRAGVGLGRAFDGEAMAMPPCVLLGEAAPFGATESLVVVRTDCCGPRYRNSRKPSIRMPMMPRRLKKVLLSTVHFTASALLRQSVRGYRSLTDRSQDGNTKFFVFGFLRRGKRS